MVFQIGQEVGNYRILKRLGAGGMGEVFLAEHPLIGKTVALKVIHQDMNVNKDLVARFINEAKAVSTIGNEHIVEVHDFGTTPQGAHFFVMEYLEGQTLAKAKSEGQLSLSDPEYVAKCLHIGAQVAAGLAAAHEHNIIHRDLKPDNVMLIHKLGDPLFVKILDFGLAKMLESETQLTGMGVVLGTPQFMSPEAAKSQGIDGRSDIYSCGVLLFYMLTGRLPFTANSIREMTNQHICKAPPVPRSINPQIPPAVEQVVLRCLAKAREDRFQSMNELRAALMAPEAYLSGSPKVVASDGAPCSASAPHPAMERPAPTTLNTRSIGTPPGYAQAGRRRMGTVIAVALLSGGGGVAAALAQGGAGQDTEAEVVSAAPVQTASAPRPRDAEKDAAKAVAASPDPETPKPRDPELVVIRIASEPEGALVSDSAGEPIGTTPFDWTGPIDGVDVSWRFTLSGHSPMTYRFAPTGGDPISVALEAKRPTKQRKRVRDGKRRRPNRKRPSQVENSLLTPDL
ncbi:MAG: protein kinase [Myxococcales bacterium]|nr:protein kinase [Myxococcales bacterium]